MKKIFLCSLMLVFMGFMSHSFAQDKVEIDVFASKVKNAGETGKYKLPARDPEVPKPAKSRGDCCTFTNNTGFTVYFWVDTKFRGSIAPWGEMNVCFNNGDETWYMMTVGATYEWKGNATCPRHINIRGIKP